MPYYVVENFAAGMDLRKSEITAPAGTLRTMRNCHVTAGGEIESRSQFVYFADAPAGTFGLVATKGLVYGVCNGGANVAATASTVGRLAIPSAKNAVAMTDWDLYDERFYIAVYCDTPPTIENYFQDAGTGDMVLAPAGVAYLRTYKSRMWGVAGKTLYYSDLFNPAVWPAPNYINLAVEDADMINLIGLEVYYDYLAIMSNEATQLWFIDPDPLKNTFRQVLRQAGTVAPRSLRQYGSGDVLYLGADGIRSLKAREQSVSAAVSDIGSPIDPYIRGMYASGPNMGAAIATLQPYTGRYWMVFPDRIAVLSNFPNPKISAWSIYEPGFTIKDAADAGGHIYLLASDNKIYRYGGIAAVTYDNTPVEVVTPFLGMDKPATFKQLVGLDAIATGEWDVYVALNPTNTLAEDYIGKLTKATFVDGQFPLAGSSTHVSLRFRSSGVGPHSLASLIIHYIEGGTG